MPQVTHEETTMTDADAGTFLIALAVLCAARGWNLESDPPDLTVKKAIVGLKKIRRLMMEPEGPYGLSGDKEPEDKGKEVLAEKARHEALTEKARHEALTEEARHKAIAEQAQHKPTDPEPARAGPHKPPSDAPIPS